MDIADMTLEEMRAPLVTAMLSHVPFDGWSAGAAAQAEHELGLTPGTHRLVFPGGAFDMVDAWIATADTAMVAALDTPEFHAMKIRAKITTAIRTRLEQAAPHKEALRRASAILASPANSLKTPQLTWRTADGIWRLAGDTSTDFNHYSKRALAGATYAATLIYFLNDDSEDHADTWAFLDRRIANVMEIEKLKARLKPQGERFSVARFLGRLRYPQP